MYNYKKFRMQEYDILHSKGIQIGEVISDFEVFTIEGERKRISDYFDKPIVLETGSISCGMFAGKLHNMEELANENKDFVFLILYVREAHPGNKIVPHNSIDSKCYLANQLKEIEQVSRTIIIDDLEGSFHKMLGGLPNMVFMIDTEGRIVFKSNWNKVNDVRSALNIYRVNRNAIDQQWTFLPMPSLKTEHKVFKRAGWDAAWDLVIALPQLIYLHIIEGICMKYPRLCKQ